MGPDSSKNLLAYTPMLHSRLFTETAKFRDHHFQPTREGLATWPESTGKEMSSSPYLDGNPSTDRPLIVQFCANTPDELLEAAQYVEPHCDAVDLNLGCPQGIAKRGNYGAFLQEDWDLIYRLIDKLHLHLDIPVTAKMRILETKEKTLDYAKMILSAGASFITIHGRQRDQKGHNTGLADWSVLKYLRERLPAETVIFANGNILRHDDIEKCLEDTGADGVMSAEGNLHDPTIFAKPPTACDKGGEYWPGRHGKGGYRVDAVFRRYMDIIYKHVLEQPSPQRSPLFTLSNQFNQTPRGQVSKDEGPQMDGQPPKKRQKGDGKYVKPSSPNLLALQAHLFRLLRPLVTKHTNIRDALAKSRAGDMTAFETVLHMVEDVVRDGLLDYESDPAKYDCEVAKEKTVQSNEDESSVATVKECRRPWWVCQPYVRPLPKEALEKGSLTMSKKEKRKPKAETVPESAELEENTKSERQVPDVADFMQQKELPAQGMVCG